MRILAIIMAVMATGCVDSDECVAVESFGGMVFHDSRCLFICGLDRECPDGLRCMVSPLEEFGICLRSCGDGCGNGECQPDLDVCIPDHYVE